MIDTHTHIYEPEFREDLADVLLRAEEAGVDRFIFPAIDSESYGRMVDTADSLPGRAFPCIGLHPTSVGENWKSELDFVFGRIGERRWTAIGEIGLDGHWSREYMDRQKEVFRIQMTAAYEAGLPVIMHVRDATDELHEVLDELAGKGRLPKGVFHAFTGSAESYRRLKSYGGFKFGIGGVVTFRNAHLASTVAVMSPDDIVLETDAPYLAPVPFRGRRNEPSYLSIIAGGIARLRSESVEEVMNYTTANAESLFGLS